ncbi:GNAT family N-acetyltransferase [Simiduia sp. 21SJ11W-1]|uniref:GNAT family N-acetyltransferase n=1 Tax=Simiduia sp. 21SJ11W-1 TaxID=2909669 RepID=UPI00209D4BF3|nr:GNAT family N-acetyltransferase [Simiduia sp. 21SJ11W-1]UTA47711.1 GNAT family N-acetyltransferase [Simiduia sp. 21SJ11W-1]
MRALDIRVNESADFPAFAALNRAWIEAYFEVEPSDAKVLDRPAVIVEQGGFILTLAVEGNVQGCCALLKNGAQSFELAKMAVAPKAQGQGLSHRLMEAAIGLATRQGAAHIDLLTSSKLTTALALYEKYNFVRQQGCRHADYARCDVIMKRLLA